VRFQEIDQRFQFHKILQSGKHHFRTRHERPRVRQVCIECRQIPDGIRIFVDGEYAKPGVLPALRPMIPASEGPILFLPGSTVWQTAQFFAKTCSPVAWARAAGMADASSRAQSAATRIRQSSRRAVVCQRSVGSSPGKLLRRRLDCQGHVVWPRRNINRSD
jgi:hypothetical protein